jgi:hypothetical protein
MTTEDLIILIFCAVDDEMGDVPRHPQARLYPSELVTIGRLFALKGGHFRAFYRWLSRDYAALFAGMPEHTRLQRLLQTHQDWSRRLLAAPTFFTVIDSYPIELLFPIRAGRSHQQVGKKGKDKGRWSVGVKLCWILNNQGQVVDWDWATMNVHDQHFHPLIERFTGCTIMLADWGFAVRMGFQKIASSVPKARRNLAHARGNRFVAGDRHLRPQTPPSSSSQVHPGPTSSRGSDVQCPPGALSCLAS